MPGSQFRHRSQLPGCDGLAPDARVILPAHTRSADPRPVGI